MSSEDSAVMPIESTPELEVAMETGTGKVKYCILSSAKEYDPPKCTPWSEDVPVRPQPLVERDMELCKEENPEDPFRCVPDAR